jgi:site-specific DNA-methyltransferase (cytosine-N4-specific)
MYWLGFDPVPVREAEMGARPHYFKKNHQTELDYERQMTQVFTLLAKVMRPGALACFIVGRSVIHGRVIDNEQLLQRAAAPLGFRSLVSIERDIPTTRKAFNPAHGTINAEKLLIFAR